MVVFDSTFLIFLFVPNAACGVERPRDRIDFLIGDLHGKGESVVVPAPALSEILVRAGHSTKQILKEVTRSTKFRVEPFDTKAAVEAAQIAIEERKKGSKRGDSPQTWAKLNYDRQIVAIAKSIGARAPYSEDTDLRKLAQSWNIPAKGMADCQLPASLRQAETGELFSKEEDDGTQKPNDEKP